MKFLSTVLLTTVVSSKSLITAIDETAIDSAVVIQPAATAVAAVVAPEDPVATADVKIAPIKTTDVIAPVDAGVKVPTERQVSP